MKNKLYLSLKGVHLKGSFSLIWKIMQYSRKRESRLGERRENVRFDQIAHPFCPILLNTYAKNNVLLTTD